MWLVFLLALLTFEGVKGGLVLFAELHCPEPELERRIERPGRARFKKLHSKARYRELRDSGSFQSPAMPAPGLSIDTGTHAPAESARLIQQALDAGPPGAR